MIIELSKNDKGIVCNVSGQNETSLAELALGLMFASSKQIIEAFGESKPEWRINFEPTKEEDEQINMLKSTLDKAYSK